MTTTTIPEDVRELADKIGMNPDRIAHNCHGVSLAIVQSEQFGPNARVARGWAKGVGSQHSWVVFGDPYAPSVQILDATLWSYDESVLGVWQGTARAGVHVPHGAGPVFRASMPTWHGGEEVALSDEVWDGLSEEGQEFLTVLGPLDYRGWHEVAHLPVEGWPAREIIEAMLDTPTLEALVPIDIVGMLTDRNPRGLYMAKRSAPV